MERGERGGRRARAQRVRLGRWQSSHVQQGPLPEGVILGLGAQPPSCDDAGRWETLHKPVVRVRLNFRESLRWPGRRVPE